MDSANSFNTSLDLRFGHGDGFTDLTFKPGTNDLLTGGIDGECRVWPFKDGQISDDAESFSACDAIYGIACSKDKFYVATESPDVRSYELSTGNYEGLVVRFSAEVYCIAISSDFTTLAAGSADFKIKLVSLKDNSFIECKGHDAPVLSLSFDPSGKFVASSSCDGTVRIWNVQTGIQEFLWQKNHPATSDLCYSNTQARISWHPVEKCVLAIPSNEQIKLVKCEEGQNDWKELASSKAVPSLISVASLSSFSCKGNLLALACGVTGNIAIWHSKSLSSSPLAVMVREESVPVTALLFHPSVEETLLFADKNGKYGVLKIENSSSHQENLDSLVDDLYGDIHKQQEKKDGKSHTENEQVKDDFNDIDMTEMTSENIFSEKNELESTSNKEKGDAEEKEKNLQKSIEQSSKDSDSDSDDEPIIKPSRKRKTAFIQEEADEKNASEGDSDEDAADDAIDAADFINDDAEEEENDQDEETPVNTKKSKEQAFASQLGAKKAGDKELDEDDFDDGSTFNEDDMIAALADVEPQPPVNTNNNSSTVKSGKGEAVKANNDDNGDVDPLDMVVDELSDIGAIKAEYEPKINPLEDDDIDLLPTTSSGTKGPLTNDAKKVVESYTQSSFQPGSTPLGRESRFMLWNDVGIVKAYYSEDTDDTIEVVFHDQAVHHSINLNNGINYTIAALSTESFVLATQYDELAVGDETNSSKLLCMNFTTWDEANKEWRLSLPDGEFVEALTLGSGFVAVATDKRFLRLFTIGGVQTFMLSLPGDVVCLTASENSLMVVYNSASGVKKNPYLSAYLLKINAKSGLPTKQPLQSPVPLALTPDCILYWAGFTDEGSPCIVDTSGVVRLLKPLFGNTWMPIVDMKEDLSNKNDNYFVVSVSELSQNVRCLFCKGSKYPSLFPYPTPTNVPFVLPFIARGSTKGSLEERASRAKIFTGLLERLLIEGKDVESALQANYRAQNEALLRLFALAITNNCESLALEIAYLMPTGQAVDSAVRYAVGKRCMALAEKLRSVALAKDDEEAEREQEEEEQAHQNHQSDLYHVSPKKSVVPEIASDHAPVLKPKKISVQSKDKKKEQETQSTSSSEYESDAENQPKSTKSITSGGGKPRVTSKVSSNGRQQQCKEREENFINDDSSDEEDEQKEEQVDDASEDDEEVESSDERDNNDTNSKRNKKKTSKQEATKKGKNKSNNKGPIAANPFEAAARKRKAETTAGFEMFYRENLDEIKEENGIEEEADCRIIARDMFKSLSLSQRNEWESKAQSKSSKKAKR